MSIDLSNRVNENMPGKVVELMGSSRAGSDTIQSRSNFEQQRYMATNESGFANGGSNEVVMLPQFGAALTT